MSRPSVIVAGAGLIGAAAARHLAKAGHDVTLIGAPEPVDVAAHEGPFGSHYDEGRITRRNALDPFWTEVSDASIARYGEIEREGSIRFFTEAGALMAGTTPWMARVEEGRRRWDVACDALDADGLRERFPFFAFPDEFSGLHEPRAAGHVSPRRLVAAQIAAARLYGARVVRSPVEALGPGWARTAVTRHEADEVIVAAGAWTDRLLGRAPRLDVYARTVALFALDGEEAARLSAMPSVVYEAPEDPYLLPPIRYPDGTTYLKLGGDPADVPLRSDAEVADWFRSGGSAPVAARLTEMIRELIPGLRIRDVHTKACVTSWTADRRPEIARLAPRLSVAAGGNGSGAKCSDELGRRAALLVQTMEMQA